MTDIETELPCARGCTWDSIEPEEPRPKPAKHGVLCNSCFYRIRSALELVPDLLANMRAQIVPFGAQKLSERVSGGGDGSPAPLNLGPLDAGDSLYAKLASWIEAFSEEFGYSGEWAIPSRWNAREVQGSPTVSVETAHRLGSQLTQWFLNREEQIAESPAAVAWHDDLCYGWEDARGVFPLSAAYGVKGRPTPETEKRPCPLCGAVEMAVYRPDADNPDLAIMCGRCAHILPPDTKKYAAFLKELDREKEQVNAEA